MQRVRLSLLTGLCFGVLLQMIAVTAGYAQKTFVNPVLPRGADPSVIVVGKTYYSVNGGCMRHGTPVICLRAADSLEGLREARPRIVWNAPSSGPNAHDVWAPQIRFLDGKFYIYYAADPDENTHHRLFALVPKVAGEPMEDWVEADTGAPHGALVLDWKAGWAIDPDVFPASDGKEYLIFACRQDNSGTRPGMAQSICIAQMSDPLHLQADPVTGRKVVELALPDQVWENRFFPTEEGPFGFTKDGVDYILYSASFSGTPDDYAEAMLINRHPPQPLGHTNALMNPAAWVKVGPVFDGHHAAYGTASNVLLDSPDGTELWQVYHGTNCLKGCEMVDGKTWNDRSVRVQKAGWSETGELVLGYPVDIQNTDGSGMDVPLIVASSDGSGTKTIAAWGAAFGDAAEGLSSEGQPVGVWRSKGVGEISNGGVAEQMQRTFYASNPNLQSYVLFTRMKMNAAGTAQAMYGVYAAYVDRRNYFTVTIDPACGASGCVVTQGAMADRPVLAESCALPAGFDAKAANTLAVEAVSGSFTVLVNDRLLQGKCQGRHVSLDEGQAAVNGSNGQTGVLAQNAAVEFSSYTVSAGVPLDSAKSGRDYAFRNAASGMEPTVTCGACKDANVQAGVVQYPAAAPYPLIAAPVQLWRLREHAGGTFAIVNDASGMCFEAAGPQDGAAMVPTVLGLSHCNGSDAQQWWLLPVPVRSSFVLQSAVSTFVLSADGAAGPLHVEARTDSASQAWELVEP
jgi:GH43 family beta-xylosidase